MPVTTEARSALREDQGIDPSYLRTVLSQLAVLPADRVESQSLEVKSWCRDEKQLCEKLSEAASCLANAGGGILIIGIAEEGEKGDRFSACPYPDVNPEWLSRRLKDSTFPPVESFAFDIGEILTDVIGIETVDAFALRIPKTAHVSGHITIKGISKIRIGKECRPNYTAEDDRTKLCVPCVGIDDLSIRSIEWAMSEHERQYHRLRSHWASATDFLLQARLLEVCNDSTGNEEFRVPLATLLLFGNEEVLAKHVGYFETLVTTPIGTIHIRKNIVDSFRELCSSRSSIISSACPNIAHDTLKELLVNAYVHRCYRLGGAVTVTATLDTFELRSPGELAAGLSSTNLIYCVPAYRNLLLADGARFIGLCDKIGQGIDIVYRKVLSGGFDFPIFESEGGTFTVTIPVVGSLNFKEFVHRRSQTLTLLDEIVVLRILYSKGDAIADELYSGMQRGRDVGRRILQEMTGKMMIERLDSERYGLSPVIRQDIDTIFQSDQLNLGLDLYGDS